MVGKRRKGREEREEKRRGKREEGGEEREEYMKNHLLFTLQPLLLNQPVLYCKVEWSVPET